MYKAVCADCGMDCEVPFKPKGDRQVYCKQCFARRRNKNSFKPLVIDNPKVETPINVQLSKKPKSVKIVKAVKKPKVVKPAKSTKKSKSVKSAKAEKRKQ